MTRSKLTILEKISQSEAKIKQLIAHRKQELLNILTKHNALIIDNILLEGFLIFALNPANKNHSFLSELRELAITPSSARKNLNQRNNKAAKTTN